jgi:hypothetical protein
MPSVERQSQGQSSMVCRHGGRLHQHQGSPRQCCPACAPHPRSRDLPHGGRLHVPRGGGPTAAALTLFKLAAIGIFFKKIKSHTAAVLWQGECGSQHHVQADHTAGPACTHTAGPDGCHTAGPSSNHTAGPDSSAWLEETLAGLNSLTAETPPTCAAGKARPLVPACHRRQVFAALHGVAHPGIRASRRLISHQFLWKGMRTDIANWCKDCQACHRSKTTRQPAAAVQPNPVPSRQFSHVHMDLVGPLPTSAEG